MNLGSNNEINVYDIYFVRSLLFNLLAVGAITDLGLRVVFDNKECIVCQGPNNNIMGRGHRDPKTGLYRYLMSHPKFHLYVVTSSAIAQFWHYRLGLLNFYSVRSIYYGEASTDSCSQNSIS